VRGSATFSVLAFRFCRDSPSSPRATRNLRLDQLISNHSSTFYARVVKLSSIPSPTTAIISPWRILKRELENVEGRRNLPSHSPVENGADTAVQPSSPVDHDDVVAFRLQKSGSGTLATCGEGYTFAAISVGAARCHREHQWPRTQSSAPLRDTKCHRCPP
jgi:hypothetical protein